MQSRRLNNGIMRCYQVRRKHPIDALQQKEHRQGPQGAFERPPCLSETARLSDLQCNRCHLGHELVLALLDCLQLRLHGTGIPLLPFRPPVHILQSAAQAILAI